jgi:hypothetical protein
MVISSRLAKAERKRKREAGVTVGYNISRWVTVDMILRKECWGGFESKKVNGIELRVRDWIGSNALK